MTMTFDWEWQETDRAGEYGIRCYIIEVSARTEYGYPSQKLRPVEHFPIKKLTYYKSDGDS